MRIFQSTYKLILGDNAFSAGGAEAVSINGYEWKFAMISVSSHNYNKPSFVDNPGNIL